MPQIAIILLVMSVCVCAKPGLGGMIEVLMCVWEYSALTHEVSQVRIWNMRLRIMMLVGLTRDLAEYGPAKLEPEQGVDDIRSRFQVS